nr:hypothetical protein [Sulfitobacter geojensis]
MLALETLESTLNADKLCMDCERINLISMAKGAIDRFGDLIEVIPRPSNLRH